jgi:hypothetical protein
MFYVLYPFVTYLLTVPPIRCCCCAYHIPLIVAGERRGVQSEDDVGGRFSRNDGTHVPGYMASHPCIVHRAENAECRID